MKVGNLGKNVKNDGMKLVFMNQKIGGGKVTKVIREEKGDSAIVYFADYQGIYSWV